MEHRYDAAPHTGVTSVVWFGIALVGLAVTIRAGTGRRRTPPAA